MCCKIRLILVLRRLVQVCTQAGIPVGTAFRFPICGVISRLKASRLILAGVGNKLSDPGVLRGDCVSQARGRRSCVTLMIGYSDDADN